MMASPNQDHSLRDDAKDQPESGYPDGRLPTKASAELDDEKARRESQSGSEAEFNSPKKNPATR